MEEIMREISGRSHEIMLEITPFISPVDGSIVSSRRKLAEHNKRNNVTNAADFTETWKRAAKERAAFYEGRSTVDRKNRIEALKNAYDKHR